MTKRKKIEREADQVDSAAGPEPVRNLRGLLAVYDALDLEDFPMQRVDVDYAVGDIDLDDEVGGTVAVHELTDSFSDKIEFRNPEEVIRALRGAVAARH